MKIGLLAVSVLVSAQAEAGFFRTSVDHPATGSIFAEFIRQLSATVPLVRVYAHTSFSQLTCTSSMQVGTLVNSNPNQVVSVTGAAAGSAYFFGFEAFDANGVSLGCRKDISDVGIARGFSCGSYQLSLVESVTAPVGSGSFFGHNSVASDFNGDGLVDLVLADTNGANVLSGMLGDSFQSPPQWTLPASSSSMFVGLGMEKVADVNGDRIDDIAVTFGNLSRVAILDPMTGSRHYDYALGSGQLAPWAMANVGDRDNDGLDELIVSTAGAGLLYYLDGDASNPVVGTANIPSGYGWDLDEGDFNGDAWIDLLVGSHSHGAILIDGFTFSSTPVATFDNPSFGSYGRSIAMEDLNGDGQFEVAVGTFEPVIGQVDIYDINGNLQKSVTGNSNCRIGYELETADLNDDGIDELIIGGNECVMVYSFLSDQILNLTTDGFYFGNQVELVGDRDGNGREEILVYGGNGSNPPQQNRIYEFGCAQ